MTRTRGDGLWTPSRRALTTGLVLTITFVATEALAVVTVMPVVARDLGGLQLYGWVFSAFMLGSIIGIVGAGRSADRRGPAVPYAGGLILFTAGLAIAGLAPSMAVLVIGRALQGIGAGAIPAVAYVAIGRTVTGRLRARMMAVLSTAWVLPGLAGPALSAEVARQFGWRWVFLGLIPLVAVTGTLAVPALLRLGPPPVRSPAGHSLVVGVVVAAGAGLLLGGLTLGASSRNLPAAVALAVAGAAAEVLALRRLLPPGALTARRGLPATIGIRGLLTFGFFGADAFVTLLVVTVRHHSPVLAGLVLTAATLSWTAGAWIQARRSERWPARAMVRAGMLIILLGIAGMAVAVRASVPVGVAVAAWAVAGLGMGLSYAPISLLMMREAPAGREGWASASLNLTDVLGTATGIGVGGAAVAAGSASGALPAGILAAFGIAALVLLGGLAVTWRLPAGCVGSPRAASAEPEPAEPEPAEPEPAEPERAEPERAEPESGPLPDPVTAQ
jgi:MFS family permease